MRDGLERFPARGTRYHVDPAPLIERDAVAPGGLDLEPDHHHATGLGARRHVAEFGELASLQPRRLVHAELASGGGPAGQIGREAGIHGDALRRSRGGLEQQQGSEQYRRELLRGVR
ncbi:hypothetical protein [Sphingomonas sp.]|uniref:hypothetical protein n=1 Tax=Sphingomonas sp. TaxID=28214 RepID=UPI0031D61FA7